MVKLQEEHPPPSVLVGSSHKVLMQTVPCLVVHPEFMIQLQDYPPPLSQICPVEVRLRDAIGHLFW